MCRMGLKRITRSVLDLPVTDFPVRTKPVLSGS